MKGVFNASLLLLHLRLSSGTNVDDSYTTSKLSKTLLELLAVVIGRCVLDLRRIWLHAPVMASLATSPSTMVVLSLVMVITLGRTEVIELNILKLDAEILGDDRTTCEDRDVFEHSLAAVTETRCLDSSHVQGSAESCSQRGRESFTVYVFSDDQKWLAALGSLSREEEACP